MPVCKLPDGTPGWVYPKPKHEIDWSCAWTGLLVHDKFGRPFYVIARRGPFKRCLDVLPIDKRGCFLQTENHEFTADQLERAEPVLADWDGLRSRRTQCDS